MEYETTAQLVELPGTYTTAVSLGRLSYKYFDDTPGTTSRIEPDFTSIWGTTELTTSAGLVVKSMTIYSFDSPPDDVVHEAWLLGGYFTPSEIAKAVLMELYSKSTGTLSILDPTYGGNITYTSVDQRFYLFGAERDSFLAAVATRTAETTPTMNDTTVPMETGANVQSSGHHLSTGALVAAILVPLLALWSALLTALCIYKRRRRVRKRAPEEVSQQVPERVLGQIPGRVARQTRQVHQNEGAPTSREQSQGAGRPMDEKDIRIEERLVSEQHAEPGS